jgi:hypothetical protein
MIQQNQACDPAVHALCMRLARRFTDIIKPLLRQEEVGECLREAYMAAREEIEKPKREPEV